MLQGGGYVIPGKESWGPKNPDKKLVFSPSKTKPVIYGKMQKNEPNVRRSGMTDRSRLQSDKM